MPLGRTPIVGSMTVRDALLNVINDDMAELFSRVEALELGVLSGVAIATEEEAVAGVDNTKAMTPLRTHQAIASNPSGYLTTVAHTKALHDPLMIDADTLDGKHASAFLQSASHTKSLHDSLKIDADTLDGYHSISFHRKDESVYLSQGQVVDFADEDGDKIKLRDTRYGIAINTNELTLYVPSGSDIAVRDSAYNGQKLGDVIHTGNMLDKGVAMPLSRLVSTSGGYWVKQFVGNATIPANAYQWFLSLTIPWTGTALYQFVIYSPDSDDTVYIEIGATEYGPYPIISGTYNTISIEDSRGWVETIGVKLKSSEGHAHIMNVSIMTGNADILYELATLYVHPDLKTW